MATDPRYMSFDHQYVETVESTSVISAHRFVTRAGVYPSAGAYAAGVSVYDAYGPGQLTAKGYQVNDGSLTALTGTIAISTAGAVTGNGTNFDPELNVGDTIKVGNQLFRVTARTSDTAATVSPAPATAVSAGATAYLWPGTYEGQLNPSTTSAAVGVFPYQGLLSIVTSGIAIVEVDPTATFALDDAVVANASGQANDGGSGVILGRALDAVTVAGAGQYIRVKLGNEAGA